MQLSLELNEIVLWVVGGLCFLALPTALPCPDDVSYHWTQDRLLWVVFF